VTLPPAVLCALIDFHVVVSVSKKDIRLDGVQCLKRKRTKKIKNIEKHVKEERNNNNNYVSKL
jgi:hypothetical protein